MGSQIYRYRRVADVNPAALSVAARGGADVIGFRVEGALPGDDAGRALGMKVATVFVAKSKVQKMIQEELGKLDAAD